jgi:hypothetical protein
LIRLFRSNHNIVLIILLFYALLLRLVHLFYQDPLYYPDIQQLEPLSRLLYNWFELIPLRKNWLEFILSTALIYAQALLLNNTFPNYCYSR